MILTILAQASSPQIFSGRSSLLLLLAMVCSTTVMLVFMFALVVLAYKRAGAGVAFVRTGMRGRRVIVNGGALAIPGLHEITPVGLQTMTLDLPMGSDVGLRSSDRKAIRMAVRFLVHVPPNAEAVGQAALSFGKGAHDPAKMVPVIRDKLQACTLEALATTSASDLLEARADFAKRLKDAASATLKGNGLEVESVLLTELAVVDPGQSPTT